MQVFVGDIGAGAVPTRTTSPQLTDSEIDGFADGHARNAELFRHFFSLG